MPAPLPDRLRPNQTLDFRQQLRSSNEKYVLTMQRNGNLVLRLRDDGTIHWQSNTANHGFTHAILEPTDGKFYLHRRRGVGESMGWGGCEGVRFIVLNDDGSLVIYGPGDYAYPVAHMHKPVPPPPSPPGERWCAFGVAVCGDSGAVGEVDAGGSGESAAEARKKCEDDAAYQCFISYEVGVRYWNEGPTVERC